MVQNNARSFGCGCGLIKSQRHFGLITIRRLPSVYAASLTLMLGLLAYVSPGNAAQTFQCSDGSSITVRTGELEWMKQHNRCVADYFAPAQQQAGRPPLPLRNPVAQARLAEVGEPGSTSRAPRTTGSLQQAQDPVAKGTFRKVLILNAAPGKPRYFEHSR